MLLFLQLMAPLVVCPPFLEGLELIADFLDSGFKSLIIGQLPHPVGPILHGESLVAHNFILIVEIDVAGGQLANLVDNRQRGGIPGSG